MPNTVLSAGDIGVNKVKSSPKRTQDVVGLTDNKHASRYTSNINPYGDKF